jgi:hypothetical protein
VALNAYIADVQRLLHDPNANYFAVNDLTSYINKGRSQIAIKGQCVRLLISGSVSAIAITNGGSGYDPSTVIAVQGSGMGAIAAPTIVGGVITGVTLISGGSGYDNNTSVIAVDPTGAGAGAVFAPTLIGVNLTGVGQEQYLYSTRAAAAQQLNSGVRTPLGIFSVAVSWGSMKPMLTPKIWSEFQAYYRSYSTGMQSYPTIWSQYAQGDKGSMFVWPLPSQSTNMDWDTYCDVIPLQNDTDPEALPYPWTEAVKFYAAYLALDNAQRAKDSDRMHAEFLATMKSARADSEPPFWPEPYASEY